MIKRLLPTLLMCCLMSAPLQAQTSSSSVPAAAIFRTDQPFDPVTATRAWLETVSADARAKSDAYFEGGYWLILWNFLLSVAISIFLLQSRISARLRDFAERRSRSEMLRVILYAIPFFTIVAVLTFPLEWYQSFFREHQYGMATQTFGPWFADEVKAFLIILIFGSLGLVLLYAVFRRAPRTWTIWGACLVVCLGILGNFVFPVFVEPLFNKYTPLQDPTVREPILAMARANEIPVDKVFVFDASRQTTRIGANVAGLFGTTRIALNDNLIKRCSLPEIREVMAHEMGHYVLNHGAKLTIYLGLFALAGFVLSRFAFDRALRKWGDRWKIRGIADPAALPLLIVIFSTYVFLITPLTNSATRVTEREADAFGINTCREPDGAAMVDLKLGQYRKLDPGPVEEFIFFDHPSGRARIRMAMDWKAAHLPCGNRDALKPATD